MKLLIATQNQAKLKEIKQILTNIPHTLVTPSQTNLPKNFDVPETGKTFKANALLKAKAFAQKTNLFTAADDSGLVIDALNGQPGIHSARFANNDFSTAMKKILIKLEKIPQSQRTAKFVCVIALYHPQKKTTVYFTGETHGWIVKPKGNNNFGYDPIFLSKDLNITFGQASFKQKNQVSARARAFNQLKTYLSQSPPGS